ncbi:MAG: outer membrane beta-barrel protein [Hyphomicrobium sp.]|uniref:outer membrane protein n=1 Tax=Hyphomicrobium sp. TaxID=82 RepID=UPI00132A1A54|nr:outer membrane beta-barrel protein [Hyphomicrobium sp.]KAB2940058.1 MAG: porin family protein [Hyphomicrobium sp.]MBZ0209575.1 outer membrane beta-barrel protein [Hyphomicrobium sp.]
MNTNRSSYSLGAALGSAIVLALCAPAMAADIYDGGLKGGYDVPPPPPSDRGIYFKGYVGQANSEVGSMFNEGYAENSTFQIYNHDMKTSVLYGLGIGWQARHWLRFDLTGEYRGDAAFFGADSYRDPFASSGTGAATNEYTADIKSWLGLVNAYIDMGNWCGFTPYIGAGIGFASLTVEGLKDINVPNHGVAFGANSTSTNFAWAIHAGVSYDVTPQMVVDLAYRYADLGTAESGPVTTYLGQYSYAGHQIKDITSNDLLLGVRYKLQREAVVYQPVK